MKQLLLLSFYIISSSFFSQENNSKTEITSPKKQKYSHCKIITNSEGLAKLANLGIAVDHGTIKKNTYFISDFSESEIDIMKQNNFAVEVLQDDMTKFYVERSKNKKLIRDANCSSASNSGQIIQPANFNLGSMAGFFTYQEFLDEIDQMAALYPNLISTKAPISTFLTHENRPIYWLKISDNPNQDETEAEVLYSSIHHAREPASLSSTIYYMWYLLENYSNNPEVKYLVDETEMYFIPLLNPDGYIENQTANPDGGGLWRKNKRDHGGGVFGVDLNRNYSYQWGTTGVNFSFESDTYPGTGPFSEPETQAMKWFCENRDFTFAFNAHTYSNLILFPIGATTDEFAVDHDYFQNIGNEMTRFSDFIAEKSSNLYPASGDSDDYMYLDDLNLKPKIYAFTPEIGGDDDGFWPAEVDIAGICEEMLVTNLTLAHAPHNYWKVSETDPNNIVNLSGNFNHTVLRLGLLVEPLNVSIQALTGIQSVGNAANYSLALNQGQDGSISYVLNPEIMLGDEIKYVLISNFGLFSRFDTITKTFGNPTIQYQNEANDISDWTGTWNLTQESFFSPNSSFTDSPLANYANNSARQLQFNRYIDLTNATLAKIEFHAKWNIETDFDFAQFLVSTDNGTTWIPQCGKYTNAGITGNGGVQTPGKPLYDGVQDSWVLEEISLNDYLGDSILVKFRIAADGGLTEDGFYFDDFKILYNVDPLSEDNSTIGQVSNYFNIFPNPANTKISISSSKSLMNCKIRLLDVNGKIVFSESIDFHSNLKEIPTAAFENGIYMLEFIDDKNQMVRRKLTIIQ